MGRDRKTHSSDIFHKQFLLYFQGRHANRNHYLPDHNLYDLHNPPKVEAGRNLRLLKGIGIKKVRSSLYHKRHFFHSEVKRPQGEERHPIDGQLLSLVRADTLSSEARLRTIH